MTACATQIITCTAPVACVPLHEPELSELRESFKESGASLGDIKRQVQDIVLPKIRDSLRWKSIRAIKGRVNDWRTVELKYNSLFHRDRHIYGSHGDAKASRQNLSAVVYLDKSRLVRAPEFQPARTAPARTAPAQSAANPEQVKSHVLRSY